MNRRTFFGLLLAPFIVKKTPAYSNYSDIQRVNITADLGRTPVWELGRKMPYYKFTNYPVNITEEIKLGGQ